MLFAFHSIDYAVLAGYLVAMLAIGAYFSRQQKSSEDFFLAGRSMGWFPLGLSIMATLLSALSYTGVPGEAYYEGLHFLLMPLAAWAAVPLLVAVVLPLFHRLRLSSIYEYLEWRFGSTTRYASSLAFVVWRLLWLGGVLYAPCKVLVVAAGLDIPTWVLLLILGLVSTLYTFLGGMKAVIWTDVIQTLVMAGGIILIVGAVWLKVDGGPSRVWEVAQSLERTEMVQSEFSWTSKWTIWGIMPHFFLAFLSFYVADQITVQRYLTARSLGDARQSFVLNCVSVSLMIPALMYVGMCLLAFYHDRPEEMRAIWVANVDPATRESLVDPETGGALLPWDRDDWTADDVRRLVEDQRLVDPNRREPFASAEEILGPAGDETRPDIDRLAARRPPPEGLSRGEVVLHPKAKDELMPRFVTRHLPFGLAGLILAALFAASMSSMDSGLNSICTLLLADFHRRLGVGRQWLARTRGKDPDQLNETDELVLARPLVLVVGLAATLFSLAIARIDDIFTIMVAVVNTFGGPLLAVFLLGMLSRRANERGALAALLGGTLFTLWLMLANTYDAFRWAWPFAQGLNSIWPLTFGVVFSGLLGWLVSWTGPRVAPDRLHGLVIGCGRLGDRRAGGDRPDDTAS